MKIKDNNIYSENSIRTFTGKVFDLKIMDPDSICIEDIAHGLANTARFAGQLPTFYSVAQHSIWVASRVPNGDKLAALLHDASEAYLGDMPSPFKKLMPEFKMFEDNLMKVIAHKFGFEYPLPPAVKSADKVMLDLEWDFFVNHNHSFYPFREESSERTFLEAFYQTIDFYRIK